MKTYGIFTAYSPNTRFDTEGLGRYLATFVKAAGARDDVRFAVACPSWSRNDLKALFKSFDIDPESYFFVGPARLPLAQGMRDLLKRKRRKNMVRRHHLEEAEEIARKVLHHLRSTLGAILVSRNLFQILVLGLYLALVALVSLPFFLLGVVVAVLKNTLLLGTGLVRRVLSPYASKVRKLYRRHLGKFDRRYIAAGIYRAMLHHEINQIVACVARRTDIVAWYSPTALWPEIHQLRAPKLICIPDMVLSEFPVAFALHGEQLRLTFQAVQRTLDQPAHFVTYSDRTRWRVAVERYGISPRRVSVVPHAANDLSGHVKITGFPNLRDTEQNYKEFLLSVAIRDRGRYFLPGDVQVDFPFLFYASQFRPSKNLMVLLKAYHELHRRRHFGRKLILTGNLAGSAEVQEFIRENNLHNDVLFLNGLEVRELAAAYSLADLAVNPSLSEGGMPFTFTEALSVGTPVVMADIEVTREVLTDIDVFEATAFDPYDWRALADKIEWALANRDQLYAKQRRFYDEHLASRTWDDVVAEHIDLLDKLATGNLAT